jgi:UDP-N-acetylglucosamine 1-carboxyvinyltransferase
MMGADVTIAGRIAIISGGNQLTGAKVTARDLRAGAALVLAGLAADGESEICDISKIERGYENFVNKLRQLGADITRIEN